MSMFMSMYISTFIYNIDYFQGRRRATGFSLIELLVVLVILGLLAGLVGPNVLKWISSANTDTARTQIEQFSGALDLYRLEVGRYPTTKA